MNPFAFSHDDETHMGRAIALGCEALGTTWPNPAVGCVIVRDGQVLAEAKTAPGGRPHAEEQVAEQIRAANLSLPLRGAVAYISLEPCGSRSGGGTSCTDHLIALGVAEVVISCEDPSPHANSSGLSRLKAAGIEVRAGLMADQARPLIEGFVRRLSTGYPLVQESTSAEGFDAQFTPLVDADLQVALKAMGDQGYTRLFVTPGSSEAAALAELDLLD